uniref:Putative ovule protein n=1 Tax=Solanum chacoense TaxID=4108 RepID=A0A0V0GHB4_SOLCH
MLLTEAGPAVANNDCKIWNNIQTELCFKCQSCKTIFYDIIKKGWKKLSLISFVMLFLLCCVQCYYLIWFINWSKGHPWQRVYRA